MYLYIYRTLYYWPLIFFLRALWIFHLLPHMKKHQKHDYLGKLRYFFQTWNGRKHNKYFMTQKNPFNLHTLWFLQDNLCFPPLHSIDAWSDVGERVPSRSLTSTALDGLDWQVYNGRPQTNICQKRNLMQNPAKRLKDFHWIAALVHLML